ncbi:hypothetical protein L1987_56594 [Smallanthus sonchifolius]|uniref:Uncharacterized protein n=1 Tax=Smallanthus sonchifolius TaxID=185202 RepID=A0ACB9EDH9_9ASTR|nr:hypothetical protein L1987_56594 [Smallanthus sonchifolius]
MFLKVQLNWNVVIPAENIDIKGLMLQKAILVRLLDDFCAKKATKDLGYLLAVTTLDKIGEGKVREHSGDVLFPVTFTCLSFKNRKGCDPEVHCDWGQVHGGPEGVPGCRRIGGRLLGPGLVPIAFGSKDPREASSSSTESNAPYGDSVSSGVINIACKLTTRPEITIDTKRFHQTLATATATIMFLLKRRESSATERGREKEEIERKSSNHGRIEWRISAVAVLVLVAPAAAAVDDGVMV